MVFFCFNDSKLTIKMREIMKKIYLTIAAVMSWAMMSVAALAVDIIVVSHGQANDPFWSVAKNGVDKACEDMKISCKYTAPTWLPSISSLGVGIPKMAANNFKLV